jgi:hypothetical protein
MTNVPVVTRTSAGLVNAMFDTIDGLNNKTIDPEHARAVSHSARTIVQIARLELEARQSAVNTDQLKLISLSIDPKK